MGSDAECLQIRDNQHFMIAEMHNIPFAMCILLPVMTHGSETLKLTKKSTNALRVFQREWEYHSGIKRVTEIIHRIKSLKWQ